MEELEQLLYDLGGIMKERRGLYINEIFKASVEDFLKKGIENTGGVTTPFQGYVHTYRDKNEDKTCLFAVDTPVRYYKEMVMPRKSWRTINGSKAHYRLLINPPESVKTLFLDDLRHLKEYLITELEEDRKRRENAITKSVAPAVTLSQEFDENSAERYYLQKAIHKLRSTPSIENLTKLKREMKRMKEISHKK